MKASGLRMKNMGDGEYGLAQALMRGVWGCATCLLLYASPAYAQLHAGDIVLDASTGTIRTGVLSTSGFAEQRVFATELGFIAPFFASDPGFDCLPSTFTPGSRISFRVRDALRVWNGSDFSQIPAERMEIARSSASVLTPEAATTVDGFALSVGANGQWHRHYEYTLVNALTAPADGTYLLQLSLSSSVAGMPHESLPFFLIFGNNAQPSEIAAAQTYVQTVLLSGQPTCDSIDFNNDSLFPDDQDLIDFLAVLAGGTCSTPACSDIDFNNDGLFPDDGDLIAFLRVLAGGAC